MLTSNACPAIRFDLHFLSDAKIPEFLESSGWKNQRDSSHAPFNLAYPGKKSIFDHISDSPGLMGHIQTTMAVSEDFGLYSTANEVPWPEILGSVQSEKFALVDVGGADGSVLSQILHKYPSLTGEFVLQDLPDVIEKGKDKLDRRVKPMVHDFFTDQPMKGKLYPERIHIINVLMYSLAIYSPLQQAAERILTNDLP